jgi:Na+/H+ antiporter NhaA
MTKWIIVASVGVFIAWSILDFLIHGLLLQSTYAATASLWRPMDEMNRPVMSLVTLIVAACFATIYGRLIERKSLTSGIRYGAIFGLATGASMGFGSYSYMPIPLSLACSWFIGSWVEAIVAGAIVGAIVKPPAGNG